MGKIRQSRKGREKEQLVESLVSGLGFQPRSVDGGGEQNQTAATTVAAFSQVYPSKTADARKKVVVPPPPEIDTSSARGHLDPEGEVLKGTKTTAVFPNLGVQQRSLEHSTEAEEGRSAKRKPFSSPSGSQTKAKCSSLSVGTNTSGSIKETSLTVEKLVALNPQSNVVDQSTILDDSGRVCSIPWKSCLAEAGRPGVRFRTPGVGWRCLVAAPRLGCEPNSPSMSILLNQPGRASLPKVVISETEQDQEVVKEPGLIPVHDTEEIISEVIREQMQKLHGEFVSLIEAHSEDANKLFMENKRLRDGQIVLLQQVKDLEENKRVLTEKMKKAEQETLEKKNNELTMLKDETTKVLVMCVCVLKQITKLKDKTKDQKQMIDELSKENRALVQKCAAVDCHREETAQLIKDNEELQRRVSQANGYLKLMTDILGVTGSMKDGIKGRG